MPTRNISLTEHLDRFVDDRVASGDYQNASEVIREGLRLLEQKVTFERQKLERLREAVSVGLAAIDRGEFREFDVGEFPRILASMRKQNRKRRRAAE